MPDDAKDKQRINTCCPGCGKKFSLSSQWGGKVVQCKQCTVRFRVPLKPSKSFVTAERADKKAKADKPKPTESKPAKPEDAPTTKSQSFDAQSTAKTQARDLPPVDFDELADEDEDLQPLGKPEADKEDNPFQRGGPKAKLGESLLDEDKPKQEQAPPAESITKKICDACGTPVPTSLEICSNCGYNFITGEDPFDDDDDLDI